jgi:hypothetical protein
MVVLRGRFDGRKVVLDSLVPKGILADTPVQVLFETPDRAVSKAARKLPRLSELKARLSAGSAGSTRKAEVNAKRLIGRPRI